MALERTKGIGMLLKVPTEVDPNATRRKDAMYDTEVIHDVLGLGSRVEWKRVIRDTSG